MMGNDQRNRLYDLLYNFATSYELKHLPLIDGEKARLGIFANGKWISCQYQFDPFGNSYEWVAVLARIEDADVGRIAARILVENAPARGITERIIAGKLVIFGSRDFLMNLMNDEIIRIYMDDVARITRYFIDIDGKL